MVKNNILLTVLLASFAAPVLASNWYPTKNCPLNKTAKTVAVFGSTFGAVDVLSSKYTRLPRAIEFSKGRSAVVRNAGISSEVLKSYANELSDKNDANVVTNDAAVIAHVKNALERASDSQKLAENYASRNAAAPKSVFKRLLDAGVTVDVLDYNVRVNIVPAAAKVAATYVLIESAKAAVSKVTGK